MRREIPLQEVKAGDIAVLGSAELVLCQWVDVPWIAMLTMLQGLGFRFFREEKGRVVKSYISKNSLMGLIVAVPADLTPGEDCWISTREPKSFVGDEPEAEPSHIERDPFVNAVVYELQYQGQRVGLYALKEDAEAERAKTTVSYKYQVAAVAVHGPATEPLAADSWTMEDDRAQLVSAIRSTLLRPSPGNRNFHYIRGFNEGLQRAIDILTESPPAPVYPAEYGDMTGWRILDPEKDGPKREGDELFSDGRVWRRANNNGEFAHSLIYRRRIEKNPATDGSQGKHSEPEGQGD